MKHLGGGGVHSEDLAGYLRKVDPNKIGVLYCFPLWGGIWTRRYIWTLQRIHNVFWVGAARSALWIFSEQFFKVHSLKRIWDQKMLFFEEGSIFSASEAQKNFKSTA